jgi:hypothetical protein
MVPKIWAADYSARLIHFRSVSAIRSALLSDLELVSIEQVGWALNPAPVPAAAIHSSAYTTVRVWLQIASAAAIVWSIPELQGTYLHAKGHLCAKQDGASYSISAFVEL